MDAAADNRNAQKPPPGDAGEAEAPPPPPPSEDKTQETKAKDTSDEGGNQEKIIYHDAKTMLEMFKKGMLLDTGRSCIVAVEKTTEGIVNHDHDYNDIWKEATQFAQGIREFGIHPSNDTKVGIQSINCPQRVIVELACFMNNMVVLPFHRTFTEEWHQVEIAIAHRLPMLVVYDYQNLDPYLDHIEKMQNLRLIVIIKSDTIPQDLMILADRCNVRIVWFEDVGDQKKRNRILKSSDNQSAPSAGISPPMGKDAAFVFVSHGSTSKPKSFTFTHEQVVSATMNLISIIQNGKNMTNGSDILISDLNKSLPVGVMLEYAVYLHGSTVCYTRQTFHEYIEDMLRIRPTIVHILPSSLERLHHIVVERKKSPCAKWALRKTIENKMIALNEKRCTKRICLECMGSLRGGFPNSYKFTKVGFTSGDFVPMNVMAFARSLFSCYFTQIYGMTGSLGLGAHAQAFHHSEYDAIGPAAPSAVIEIKPCDKIPNSAAGSEVGLVHIKAPFMTDSYQICVPTQGDPTNPSLKLEKCDEYPLVKTTDIGTWTKSGELQLLGRLEDIVSVSGGFCSLAKVESVLRASKFVAQICVASRKSQSSLLALVYPDKEMLNKWVLKNKDSVARERISKELKPPKDDTEEVFQYRPNVEEILLADLKLIGEASQLPVAVKAVRVALQPFGPWYGQPRRYLILELFGKELNPIFDALD